MANPPPKNAHELSNAFGFQTDDEVTALKQLASMLPANPKVVNIGSGVGTSGMAFLETRGDLYCTTVDIQKDGHPHGGLENELIALNNTSINYKSRHAQIHGDSKEVGKHWIGGKLDLVFIDGDHSTAGCGGDIEAWYPHIKDGGIIAFHDYESNNWPWVQEVVDDKVGHLEQVLWVDSVIAFEVKHE